MIRTILQQYLESRFRRLIVIILSFGLSLLFIWPSADEYTALAARRSAISEELAEVRALADQGERLQKMAEAKHAALAELEARTVSPEKLHVFRGKVVELARASGCQIRRVAVGDVRRRDWRTGDNALDAQPSQDKTPAAYVLRSYPASLAVSGKLAGARGFLGRLAGLDMLLHVNQFTVQPADADGREVNLELDATLFDIGEAERPAAAPSPKR
jgi:hypothetical protein